MRRFAIALVVALPLLGGSAFAAFGGGGGDLQPTTSPAAGPDEAAALVQAASEARSSLAGSGDARESEGPTKKAKRERGAVEGPPPWAKAHGRRCKGKSKARADGEKHSEFVRCVHERKGEKPAKAKGPKKTKKGR